MIVLGTMTGQGEPRYWAMMHRIHHNRCEEGGDDPHSPAPELERSILGYGHGGFLYDRMELYELERRAPDLMDADHDVMADGRGTLLFLLLPPLLGNLAALASFVGHHTADQKRALPLEARMRRAAAVGFTSVRALSLIAPLIKLIVPLISLIAPLISLIASHPSRRFVYSFCAPPAALPCLRMQVPTMAPRAVACSRASTDCHGLPRIAIDDTPPAPHCMQVSFYFYLPRIAIDDPPPPFIACR